MRYIKFLLAFFSITAMLPVSAQKMVYHPLYIESEVFDKETSKPIIGPYVSLYSLPDTILLVEGVLADYLNGKIVPKSKISLGVDDLTKQYLIKVEKEGYRPGWIKVDASTAEKNQHRMYLDPVYLKPKGNEK